MRSCLSQKMHVHTTAALLYEFPFSTAVPTVYKRSTSWSKRALCSAYERYCNATGSFCKQPFPVIKVTRSHTFPISYANCVKKGFFTKDKTKHRPWTRFNGVTSDPAVLRGAQRSLESNRAQLTFRRRFAGCQCRDVSLQADNFAL